MLENSSAVLKSRTQTTWTLAVDPLQNWSWGVHCGTGRSADSKRNQKCKHQSKLMNFPCIISLIHLFYLAFGLQMMKYFLAHMLCMLCSIVVHTGHVSVYDNYKLYIIKTYNNKKKKLYLHSFQIMIYKESILKFHKYWDSRSSKS